MLYFTLYSTFLSIKIREFYWRGGLLQWWRVGPVGMLGNRRWWKTHKKLHPVHVGYRLRGQFILIHNVQLTVRLEWVRTRSHWTRSYLSYLYCFQILVLRPTAILYTKYLTYKFARCTRVNLVKEQANSVWSRKKFLCLFKTV